MKVSFDFDSTLTKLCIQRYAKSLVERGYNVYITTSRCEEIYGIRYDNSDLYQVADKIGIKRENIVFTNARFKYKFLTDDFIFHLDDDKEELKRIDNTKAINVNKSFSIAECEKAIYKWSCK